MSDPLWLSKAAVARELGVGVKTAAKELRRVRHILPPEGDPPRYDARVLDLLRAMRGRPHRTLEPAHSDWLARYLEGEPHARTSTRPPRSQPAGG